MNERELKDKILSTFSEIAVSIGYSSLHGMIIGTLLIKGRSLSLQQLAKETGYSISMLSLSIDLLEVLGIVKKIKKTADRKLYLELQGNLLEGLKKAVIFKIGKSINESLKNLEENKKEVESLSKEERKRVEESINILEGEMKRLKKYINLLSNVKIPRG